MAGTSAEGNGGLRQTLVDTTVRAVADDGLGAVTMRGVARRAGVSHAAPAHHFGDKAGLFTAVATEGFHLLREALRATARRQAGAPAPERLHALGNAYIAFALDHRAHFEVMFRPELLDTADTDYLAAAGDAFAELVSVVDEARAAGWGGPWSTEDLAPLAWALVHGIATLSSQGALTRRSGGRSVRTLANRLGGILVDALRPPEGMGERR